MISASHRPTACSSVGQPSNPRSIIVSCGNPASCAPTRAISAWALSSCPPIVATVQSGVEYTYGVGVRTCSAWTFAPYSRAIATANGSAASDGSEKSVRKRTFSVSPACWLRRFSWSTSGRQRTLGSLRAAVTGVTIRGDQCHWFTQGIALILGTTGGQSALNPQVSYLLVLRDSNSVMAIKRVALKSPVRTCDEGHIHVCCASSDFAPDVSNAREGHRASHRRDFT
jgi:hypothetical protein